MTGTTIRLLEVWNNRNGVSGYQVICKSRKAVSTVSRDADKHWHTICNWQPCERPWVVIDVEYEFL